MYRHSAHECELVRKVRATVKSDVSRLRGGLRATRMLRNAKVNLEIAHGTANCAECEPAQSQSQQGLA